MSELVKRLRDTALAILKGANAGPLLLEDAAAEIERLTAELAEAKRHAEEFDAAVTECEQLEAERDALRAALERIANYCGNRGAALPSVAHMAREALRGNENGCGEVPMSERHEESQIVHSKISTVRAPADCCHITGALLQTDAPDDGHFAGRSPQPTELRPFRGSFQGSPQQSHICTNCGRPWIEHIGNAARECPASATVQPDEGRTK